MQQPLEDRISSLETAAERHDETILRLTAIADHQDQLLDRLVTNQDTLQANLEALQAGQDRLEASQDRLEASQETIVTLLEELTQHTTATHRLWLRLAQRYGWLDDEQDGAGPELPA